MKSNSATPNGFDVMQSGTTIYWQGAAVGKIYARFFWLARLDMENKQTNEQGLASHWKTACYELEKWEKMLEGTKPHWVKKIYCQKEVCPTTNRLHYQAHVHLASQQRLSAMRGFFQSHWMQVKGATHIKNSINYCSKKETAIAGSIKVWENEEEFLCLHETLLAIAEEFYDNIQPLEECESPTERLRALKENEEQFLFKNASKWIVKKNISWISKLGAPFLEKGWNYYHGILLDEVKKKREGEGPISLSPAPPATAGSQITSIVGIYGTSFCNEGVSTPQCSEDVSKEECKED